MTSPASAPPNGVPSSPPRSLGGLLFQQPEEDPEEPLPSSLGLDPSTTPIESTGLPDDSPSETEWDGLDSSEPNDDAPSSSRGSSRAEIATKRGLQATARNAVKIGTGMAHSFLARTPGQREARLYLADDEDAANIGNPIGSYMSRHGGVTGKLSEDAKDALDGLMGFGGFIAKQIAAAQIAAQIDQSRGPADVVQEQE